MVVKKSLNQEIVRCQYHWICVYKIKQRKKLSGVSVYLYCSMYFIINDPLNNLNFGGLMLFYRPVTSSKIIRLWEMQKGLDAPSPWVLNEFLSRYWYVSIIHSKPICLLVCYISGTGWCKDKYHLKEHATDHSL